MISFAFFPLFAEDDGVPMQGLSEVQKAIMHMMGAPEKGKHACTIPAHAFY